jgi:hypothetical protein
MKNIINHAKGHATRVVKHLHKHRHRYGLSTFGAFAVVKMFVLFVGTLGIANLVSTFAAGGYLNSGTVVDW